MSSIFPLRGVIGIVDTSETQVQSAVQLGLASVEIRADLLRDAGLSDREILTLIGNVKKAGLSCLFTLRHADQGGMFCDTESTRIALCTQALAAGADIIDLEHNTDAATALLANGAPTILSYHNFDRMISAVELHELTVAMEALKPAAVKIIPTGHCLADAALMLAWVARAKDEIKRIGFAMGSDGAVSRLLALSRGAPVTYASFGKPVAPGQVDIRLMLDRYNCMAMDEQTCITALLGNQSSVQSYLEVNRLESGKHKDDGTQVYIVFSADTRAEVERHQQDLNISRIVDV